MLKRINFLLAFALSATIVTTAQGADCTADEKIAARIERSINNALSLPTDAVYISGPVTTIFFPWDPLNSEDVNRIYKRQMDILIQEHSIPTKSISLRSTFDAYRFILEN